MRIDPKEILKVFEELDEDRKALQRFFEGVFKEAFGRNKSRTKNKQFRLNRLRIKWISCDTEPSKTMAREALSEWQDVVITVTDEAGNDFEVTRFPVRYDGILGEMTSIAKLVREVSWGDVEGSHVKCPLCHFEGHGAARCPSKKG